MSRDESNEALREIEAELARQDEVLAELTAFLASLGDVQIQLPQSFFDELEELAQHRTPINRQPALAFGVRG
jgi:hypothetical protein